MSLSKERCLSIFDDIIFTLKTKQKQLKEDKNFFKKFEDKRIVLTEGINNLSDEDRAFVEKELKNIIEKHKN